LLSSCHKKGEKMPNFNPGRTARDQLGNNIKHYGLAPLAPMENNLPKRFVEPTGPALSEFGQPSPMSAQEILAIAAANAGAAIMAGEASQAMVFQPEAFDQAQL
jgi:hypothetical protein